MITAAILCVYMFAVSIVYALIYAIRPGAAEGLVILFVGLLIVPAIAYDVVRARNRRRR